MSRYFSKLHFKTKKVKRITEKISSYFDFEMQKRDS